MTILTVFPQTEQTHQRFETWLKTETAQIWTRLPEPLQALMTRPMLLL